MAQCNIENKITIDQAVKQAVKHVRTWTQQNLQQVIDRHQKDKLPLIITLGKEGYLIGNYALRCIDNRWHMIYRYNDQELEFTRKNSAVFYAVCQQTGRGQTAQQILCQDQRIDRLQNELNFFRARIDRARKKSQNIDLYVSRYQETQSQLLVAGNLLEKTLQMAKYINI
jgi:hypothetical protein